MLALEEDESCGGGGRHLGTAPGPPHGLGPAEAKASPKHGHKVPPQEDAHAAVSAWQRQRGDFEPLRAEPNGFLVHHLGHSVTLSLKTFGMRPKAAGLGRGRIMWRRGRHL